MNNSLKVTSLTKAYPKFQIERMSFAIPNHGITALLGKNGAGKSTLIRLITGMILPDDGSIEILGRPVERSRDAKVNNDLGIVLDGEMFYEQLTVRAMKGIYQDAFLKWDEDMYQNMIRRFAIPTDKKIAVLSKGTKAKLALTFALSHHSKFLIMDEPTSGLDPVVRREFILMLKEWVDKGERSVLFSTHIISDIEGTADQVIVIDRGRKILDESMQQVQRRCASFGKNGKAVSLEEWMLRLLEQGEV